MDKISLFYETLKSEAISELRRAAEDMSAQAVDRLSDAFANEPPYLPSAPLVKQFCCETLGWYRQIPVPVKWVEDGQPFNTCHQMARFVHDHGYLPMYRAASALHESYHRHRAVHDWFGHIVPNLPFGHLGELAAYRLHRRMYSPELHPLIFSDVVLSNVYFEANGRFFASEKFVDVGDQILRSH